MSTRRIRSLVLAPALALCLLGVACHSAGQERTDAGASDSSPRPDAGYPMTVENCDARVTFEGPPERVVLLESAPVSILQELGVLDNAVVLHAGAFPPAYYDAETNSAIRDIPSLGEELDASGHLQISQESVIARQPDLVMGLPDGFTRAGLASVGINVLVQPVYCPRVSGSTTFDDVYEQVEIYGKIFDREQRAADLVSSLKKRVGAVEKSVAGEPERSAAVLFPTVGGGTTYAYGNHSMAHPQLKAAGLSNVFGNVDERVFEVTAEELIARDPDVLVLLHIENKPPAVKEAILDLPGASGMSAVQNDQIVVQLFNFTEPPTPLSIDGLERLVKKLDRNA